jgi:predicted Zn-ribbon and HTH transcriptional regulator
VKAEYVMALERLVCRLCGWAATYDPEWPILGIASACPRCKKYALVWMSFEAKPDKDVA